ncbi:MAG TPA: SGNH/GDSL hydrolase family protein [Stellaceae bacterium]|nr:SGNH/GDSL hydrolase family protein [Stellaceae bacterium]
MNGVLAGLIILAIGDSHMAGRDYLLTHLHDQLEAQGASVSSYGMCGATAGDWIYRTTVSCGRGEHHDNQMPVTDTNKVEPTWNINDLIAKNHPNLIVIELGDAMAAYGTSSLPRPWIYDQVKALTGRIKADHIACVWVGPVWGNPGPPYYKTPERVKEIADFLSQSVAPCRFVDSTTFAQPGQWPTTDGQHLTPNGYRQWGADITAAIVRMKSELVAR